ncbi:hypothetical protein ACQ4PT_022942 [Festuca glaucescens]
MEENPRLRLWKVDPPDYGGNPDLFTVQIVHNGFFCGLGTNLTYIEGTVDYYDNCNVDTWSLLWIKDFVRELGHELTDRLHIYWCLPGKDATDGLLCIEKDADIVQMIEAAADHKELCLMVDHTNFLKQLRDDVVLNGGLSLPPVISPKKIPKSVSEASSSHTRAAAHEDEEQGVDTELCHSDGEAVVDADGEEDTDSEFYDSEWDAEDGDDDIFESQVDREVNDHNEPMAVTDLEDDATTGDEDLNLTIEEEEYLKYRFSEFNPEVGMDSPEFKTGMVFANATELRHALAAYSIRNRVKIKKTRNEASRINAVCENGCTWMLRASSDSRKEALTVRAYSAKHTCESTFELKALTAPFLTRYFLNEFRDNQKMDLATFAAKIEREFNMSPNRWKLTRARNMALTIIHGDEAVQFSSLKDYGQELRTSNPGFKFFMLTTPSKAHGEEEAKEHLSTLYWSYDACTRGFLKGCRPFICIDGCHIKTRLVKSGADHLETETRWSLVQAEQYCNGTQSKS